MLQCRFLKLRRMMIMIRRILTSLLFVAIWISQFSTINAMEGEARVQEEKTSPKQVKSLPRLVGNYLMKAPLRLLKGVWGRKKTAAFFTFCAYVAYDMNTNPESPFLYYAQMGNDALQEFLMSVFAATNSSSEEQVPSPGKDFHEDTNDIDDIDPSPAELSLARQALNSVIESLANPLLRIAQQHAETCPPGEAIDND